MKKYWKKNLDEILNDNGLILFGCLLVINHIIHFIYYSPGIGMVDLLTKGSDGVCIPGLENCLELRFLSPSQVVGLINSYGFLSLLTFLFLVFKKFRNFGIYSLLLLQILKNFIIFHDARLYSAHNYITNFLTALFIFAPDKRRSLKVLIVLVYFWSGIMHLNPQWINGILLRNWKWFPEFLTAQLVYVLILEIFICWGLLSKNKYILYGTLAQFILFHALSYSAIQWLYPTVMLFILPMFLIFVHIKTNNGFDNTNNKQEYFLISKFIIFIFCLLQLVPRLLPNKNVLFGDNRFFYSMHQFSIAVECISEGTIHFKSGRTEKVDLLKVLPFLHVRLMCEPIVAIGAAKKICKQYAGDANFNDLSFTLRSKLAGDPSDFELVLNETAFCSKN